MMKNTIKLISFFVAVLAIFGCSKELEVQGSFDYQIQTLYQSQAFLFIEQPTQIKVLPEIVLDQVTYELKYQVFEGDGEYVENGQDVPVNTYIPMDGLVKNINYVGKNIGEHKVLVSVRDSYQRIKDTLLTYNINDIDFTVSASGGGDVVLNNTKPLNLIVNQNIPDPSVNYTVKFTVNNGSTGLGSIQKDGETLNYSVFHPIGLGLTEYGLKGLQQGNVDLTIEVKDSNDVSKFTTISYNVITEAFTFSGTPQENTIIQGESTNINFDITEPISSGSDYEMKFVFTNGNANLSSGGATRNPGVFYPVSTGAFSWLFKGTNSGDIQMAFTVRNTTTQEELSQNVSISVLDGDFVFTGTPQNNTVTLGQGTNINFDITETISSGSDYEMKFIFNSGDANITSGGGPRNPGVYYPVSTGSFSWQFESVISGSISMTFTARNKTTLEEKQVSINITVIDPTTSDFNFTAIPTKTIENIGNPIIINFNINEVQGPPSTYTMLFTSSNNGSFYYQGQEYLSGQIIPSVPIGSFTGAYIGDTNGQHQVTFQVTNSSNPSVTRTANMSLTYQTDFSFIANSASGGQRGVPFPVNFNISQQGVDGSVNYTMVFTSNKPSTMTIDGIVYSQGQTIPVPVGAFSGTYLSNISGGHNVSFVVTNNNVNPISHSDEITFNLL